MESDPLPFLVLYSNKYDPSIILSFFFSSFYWPHTVIIVLLASHPHLNLCQLQVVGRQHSRLACPLYPASHPSGVNAFQLVNEIALDEAHLVNVLCLVVVHSSEDALEGLININ